MTGVRRVRRACLLLALLAPLAACGGPDLGSMTKQEAIDACDKAVAKKVDAGWTSDGATAQKDDRYWDVRGTSNAGFYHCNINAVDGNITTMLLPS